MTPIATYLVSLLCDSRWRTVVRFLGAGVDWVAGVGVDGLRAVEGRRCDERPEVHSAEGVGGEAVLVLRMADDRGPVDECLEGVVVAGV